MRKSYRKQNIAMVFGVFDGLHPGHRAFLSQAKKYGKKLVVVVARDKVVRKLKNKTSVEKENNRMNALRKIVVVDRVLLGDEKQSSYGVIKKYKPEIICLGYDQQWLAKDLKKRMKQKFIPQTRVIKLKSHHPEKFKSSKMASKEVI